MDDITEDNPHMEFIKESDKINTVNNSYDENKIIKCIGTRGTCFIFSNGHYFHRRKDPVLKNKTRRMIHALLISEHIMKSEILYRKIKYRTFSLLKIDKKINFNTVIQKDVLNRYIKDERTLNTNNFIYLLKLIFITPRFLIRLFLTVPNKLGFIKSFLKHFLLTPTPRA